MTQNQISYQRAQEEHRANLANEGIKTHQNTLTAMGQGIDREKLKETIRSNRAKEALETQKNAVSTANAIIGAGGRIFGSAIKSLI